MAGSEAVLIVKYFGKAVPAMASQMLPHAMSVVQRSMQGVAKRTPATQQLSDNQLIEGLFSKHIKQMSIK
jgi:hypothetical protein